MAEQEQDSQNLKTKYKNLKLKYKGLIRETLLLSDQLSQMGKKMKRLQKERRFLLDKLISFEQNKSTTPVDVPDPEEPKAPIANNNFNSNYNYNYNNNISNNEDDGIAVDEDDLEEYEPNPKKRKHPSGRQGKPKKTTEDKEQPICVAVAKDKPCKSKALAGCKYCWHHAPLDPDSNFTYCQYKKGNKACNVPVMKSKELPYCNHHMASAKAEGSRSSTDFPAVGLTPPSFVKMADIVSPDV